MCAMICKRLKITVLDQFWRKLTNNTDFSLSMYMVSFPFIEAFSDIFQLRSYTSLHKRRIHCFKIIPMPVFVAIVHSTLYFIISKHRLLVYKNKIDFGTLGLYPATVVSHLLTPMFDRLLRVFSFKDSIVVYPGKGWETDISTYMWDAHQESI